MSQEPTIKLHTKGLTITNIEVFGQTYPIITDTEQVLAGSQTFKGNKDRTRTTLLECVLDRIGHQFIDYQPAGSDGVNIK